MTPSGAKRTVVVSVVLSAGLATAAYLRRDPEDVGATLGRALIGVAGASIGLGLLVDPAPDLAASFAALLLVSSVLTVGPDAINAARTAVGGTDQ